MTDRIHLVLAVVYLSLATPALGDDPGPPPPPSGAGPIDDQGVGTIGDAGPSGSADNLLFTGSFLYSLPIEVPPGVAGMQPELSLQYNSSLGNGWLGVGWDFSLGNIQRSTKNGPPNYNDNDTFVLTMKGQSQELKKIADGTYRFKIEGAFQKFVREGDQWVALDKTGTRYIFGQTADSRIGYSATQTFLWALDKVIDRNGNYLLLSYRRNDSDNQIYPSEIIYTANDTASRASDRRVTFEAEPRADILFSQRPRFRMATSERLKRIKTWVFRGGAWERVKEYVFLYQARSLTNRSILSEATVTGYQGEAQQTLSLARFDTPSESTGWLEKPEWSPPFPLSSGPPSWLSYNTQFIDLNSDGLPDFVVAYSGVRRSWINTGTGWREEPAWALPANLALSAQFPYAQFADMNGDGRPDFVFAKQGEPRTTWLNTGSGWQSADQLAPPGDLAIVQWNGQVRGSGSRLVDLNDDHRADFMEGNLDDWANRRAWINTGSGWEARSEWRAPVPFTVGPDRNDIATQIIDVNGDERPDIVSATAGYTRQTYINSGSGWILNSSWRLPEDFSMSDGRSAHCRLIDLNGDRLPDFVLSHNNGTTDSRAWINTGLGWGTPRPEWALPRPLAFGSAFYPTFPAFVDVNGDGLLDFVYSHLHGYGLDHRMTWLNTGGGWVEAPTWQVPTYLSLFNGQNASLSTGAQMLDFNGDQLADFVITYPSYEHAWISRAAPNGDALNRIRNPLGGAIEISYEKSTVFPHTFLPFSLWVVKNLLLNDGLVSTPDILKTYSYRDGLFDIKEKEFLGFGRVDTIDAQNNSARSYFHQKNDSGGNPVPFNAFKGRLYKMETVAASGQVLKRDESGWEYQLPHPGVYFVRPRWNRETLLDGPTPAASEMQYLYDDAPGGPGFGNLLQTRHLGDPAVSGDEKTAVTEYAQNGPAYLLSFPQRTTVLGPSSEVLAETKYFYDGSTILGEVTRGNVTEVSRWLDLPPVGGPPRWISSRSEYNALGQVTAVVDARNSRTETLYDAWGFPSRVTHHLGHAVQSAYDPRNGQVLSDTDPNNQVTNYLYDALGRQIKVIGPLDTEALPSASYNFHLELLGNPAAQHVEIQAREEHGQAGVIWTKNYFDGLGRPTRAESEDKDGNSVITETQYDARGLAVKTSVPRFTTPASPPQWNETTYDALGRVLQVTKPDRTTTNTTYAGRTTYVQDTNGNVQSSVADAYGRVVRRNEPGIANPTVYLYNAAGNLSRVTDANGKITTFAYDSFGRKLTMNDPNAGAWSYAYDDNGNLMEQTDARSVKLSFQYDALSRISEKKLEADPSGATGETPGTILASYVYDEVGAERPYSVGRLTTVQDPSGIGRFYHDRLGRVEREVKEMNSVLYEVRSSYDALGRLRDITYPSDRRYKYQYDAAGRLDKVTNADGSTEYASFPSYNALGQVLEKLQGGGSTRTTYFYDPLRHLLCGLRLESLSGGATTQTHQDLSYTFDPAGNITGIADRLNSDRSQTFTYDALHRLKTSVGEYGTQAYAYDALGNFMTKGPTRYKYDDPLHPYAVTETLPDQLPAKDGSTLLAWDLDPAEPIYRLRGMTKDESGAPLTGLPVVISGLFDQALRSDANATTNQEGRYEFRGLAGGSGAIYSLSVASIGFISQPAGYSFNPLTQNQDNLNFTLSVDSNPLNPALVRIPRTAVAHGVSQGGLSGDPYVGGIIGGLCFGATAQGEIVTWETASGYSPLPDAADINAQPPAQYVLPPQAYTDGVLGPAFAAGRYHQALSFNGFTDLFVFPQSHVLNPSALTLMIWAKPTAYPSFGFATLITKSTGTPLGQLGDGVRLAMDGAGKVVFEIGRPGPAGSEKVVSASALPLNKWSYVAATYDGATLKVFINAKEAAKLVVTTAVRSNTVPVSIGASLTDLKRPLSGTFFYGALDEPRLQNRAWTAGEMLAAYQAYTEAATFAYDAAGNRIRKTTPEGEWTYAYDSEGRLKEVKENGASKARFVYDSAGARVKKITPAGATLYIGKLFEIRPPSPGAPGGSQVDHVFGGGEMLTEVVVPLGGVAQTYYTHGDHLGSASIVTNEAGAHVQSMAYEPFGRLCSVSGASPLRHRYTGQEDDPEIDLYFYNARYYDPALGRFISADEFVQSINNPQSLNRYTYVQNNPLVFSDPSGHFAFVPIIVGAVIGAISAGNATNWNGEYMLRGAFVGAIGGAAGGVVGGWATNFTGSAFLGGIIGGAAGGASAGYAAGAAFGVDRGIAMEQGALWGGISGGLSQGMTMAGIPDAFAQAAGSYLSGHWEGGDSAARSAAAYAFAGSIMSAVLVMNGVDADGAVPKYGSTEEINQFSTNRTGVVTPELSLKDGNLFWMLLGLLSGGAEHTRHTKDTLHYPDSEKGRRFYRWVENNNIPHPGEHYTSGHYERGRYVSPFRLFGNNCTTRFGFLSPSSYYANHRYVGPSIYWHD